ncbi:MAG: metallophosphoesterase [Lachnospiraceae bacterium]|nr:metallophosphoesterase [Lachnospiraceae bacterium]
MCYVRFARTIYRVSANVKKIDFGNDDILVIADDIIDRGTENYQILQWMEGKHHNVEFIKGNHDYLFEQDVLALDIYKDDIKDKYHMLKMKDENYDKYGTIEQLLFDQNVSIEQMVRWAKMIEEFPYLKEVCVNGKNYLIVHAGYMDEYSLSKSPIALNSTKEEIRFMLYGIENFYLWAREEALIVGGKKDTTIIAGHTPTIGKGMFDNGGKVLRHQRLEINSVIYDIDCGAGFLDKEPLANMACIRLEDEEIFYLI